MRLSGWLASVRAHWRSRVALGLAVLHAVIFFAIIFVEPPLPPPSDQLLDPWEFGTGAIVAGRYFHGGGFWFLQLADLPALLVGIVVTAPLYLTDITFSRETDSYLLAWVWFLLATIQWWACVILIEARRARRD